MLGIILLILFILLGIGGVAIIFIRRNSSSESSISMLQTIKDKCCGRSWGRK